MLNMQNLKKSISLIIILCIFLTMAFTACSVPKETGGASAAAETEREETEEEAPERMRVKDSLPDDLNFNGAVYRIFSAGENQNKYIQGPEELTGDIVFDTVIERNQIVEERLNVKFEYFTLNYDYPEVAGALRSLVLSGDDAYELVLNQQYGACQVVSEGLFVNVLNGKYFNFDQPWWSVNYMSELCIGKDKVFFLVGDYFMDLIRGTALLYFNKNLWKDYFGDEDLYTMVFDGKWTLEAINRYVKQVYRDLNGNGVHDEEDMYGYTTYAPYASVDPFSFGTDTKFTVRDDDGLITIAINNDKAVKLTEILNDFFWGEGSYVFPIGNAGHTNHFISGISLFLGGPACFASAESLRDMEIDYGMIPYPKYDEAQINYRSIPNDTRNYGMILVTSDKLEMTSAVVEALCAESYRRLMPAYYETALKVKYARDDISSQMIDLIHDSLTTEFIYAYYYSLNYLGSIFRTLVSSKSNNFASEYAKLEKGALAGLEKIKAAYLENY